MKKKKIKIKNVKDLLFGGAITKEDKKEDNIAMRIWKVKNKISELTVRGSEFKYNTATGECVFVPRKLSKDEEQKLNELKAELKKLEVKLKIAELEGDFEK